MIERAREGARVSDLMQEGQSVLGPEDVMDGVAEMLHDVQVEATFPDGRKLVTLHHPVQGSGSGDGPGATRVREGTVELNADRTDDERLTLVVVNTGDRPVQIGSHLHLPDANAALDFDREAAHGFRLDIPAGHLAAVRAGRVARGRRGRPAGPSAGAGHPAQARQAELDG